MILVAILGLFLPGYLLARALRAPAAWAIAFPLSSLILAEIIVAYTLFGIPIRFGYVLGAVVVLSTLFLATVVWRQASSEKLQPNESPQNAPKWLLVLTAVVVCLALVGIFVRTFLYPLSGPDTLLRWDALPRLMLKYQNLSYYPPVTPDDFAKYTYPDSIPPLVATIYWWLYAAWGDPAPKITSIAIVLQAVSCFALVYYAGRIMYGFTGGLMALAVLASTPFFLTGISNGQENGFTALSVAGQLMFALAAGKDPKAKLIFIAGLFAGLGGLARDYGPMLVLSGLAVLVCQHGTRRFIPLFCLVAALCTAPWFIRNWVLTGNPLYPLDTGLGFPVNPVVGGFRTAYHEVFGPALYFLSNWLWAGKMLLLYGAPLAMVAGISGVVFAGKQGIGIGLSVLLAIVLWIWTIPNTSGGILYTWRFLTPAWAGLAIGASIWGPKLALVQERWKHPLRYSAPIISLLCAGYALVCCWSQPFEAANFASAVFSAREEPLDLYANQIMLAKTLEKSILPPLGVLTDDCNLAIALQRFSRFRPVMMWSPEVAFVFDSDEKPAEIRRQLIEKGISLITVTTSSANNNYLFRLPFFSDDFKNWNMVTSIPDAQAIMWLPPVPEK